MRQQIPGNVRLAEKPTVYAEAIAEADRLRALGAGNLSEADEEAIRGETLPGGDDEPGDEGTAAAAGTATLAIAPTPARAPVYETPPEVLALAGRILSLEARCTTLETALERLAAGMTAPVKPTAPQDMPAVRGSLPSPAEAAAYTETNFALSQDNLPQHNGIQAWRDAGSPVLKAKPVEKPRGRAA